MAEHSRPDDAGPPEGGDPPCEICGLDPYDCECDECPECGAAGDPRCARGECPVKLRLIRAGHPVCEFCERPMPRVNERGLCDECQEDEDEQEKK